MIESPSQERPHLHGRLPNTEAQIRDLVAKNLAGMDPHLRLLETEHVVRRADGVEARIDILAKDDFGCYTVIEIKKSAQTSRSAVQQLYKYASFLKSARRLEGHQIRCVIVSTVWGEMRAPFGEFKHFSDYESRGYQLDFDGAGMPVYREIETSLEVGDTSPLSPFYFFEFKSQVARDTSLRDFTEILKKFPSLNSVVVPANYAGNDRKVIHPYGFAWSLFSGNAAEVEREFAQLLLDTPTSADDEVDIGEPSESDQLMDIASKILLNLVSLREGEYAYFDLHSFTNILSTWNVAKPLGFGPMYSAGFFDAREALDLASGQLGDHPYVFVAQTTGARQSHLAIIRARLDKFLTPNPGWRKASSIIFSELDSEDVLNINVFNPLNFFGFLNDLYCNGESNRIPAMLMRRRHADGTETIYRGVLRWTSTRDELSAKDAVKASYPDELSFAVRSVNQRLNEHDDKLSRLYGLTYEIVRETEGGVAWLKVDDGGSSWCDVSSGRTLQEFIDHHAELVEDVGKYFSGFSVGNERLSDGISTITLGVHDAISTTPELDAHTRPHSTNPGLIHDMAAHLFWTLVEQQGVAFADAAVVTTSGQCLIEQSFSREVLEPFGFSTLSPQDRKGIESAIAAEAVRFAVDERNMNGIIYAEDASGRSPNAKNLQLDYLAEIPRDIIKSGQPLQRVGRLCIRHPLPAVVFSETCPDEGIIEVADTRGALGFHLPMFMSNVEVQLVTQDLFVLTGILHIPVPKSGGELWNAVIQNSTRFVSHTTFIDAAGATSIDVHW